MLKSWAAVLTGQGVPTSVATDPAVSLGFTGSHSDNRRLGPEEAPRLSGCAVSGGPEAAVRSALWEAVLRELPMCGAGGPRRSAVNS